ncbi:MAG: amidohydrolase [Candidatus Omnitrophica bacterium]|nr:amidohydrolase [Candidatus Omnitrophota bacterium]
MTRRDCLKTLGASATAVSFAAKAAFSTDLLDPKKEREGYIDAHVHVWTSDTERYPLAEGYEKSNMNPPSFTPEELFHHMEGTGVDRVNLIQMSYYGFDNSYMLDVMDRYPGVFSGTAIVDPFGPDPAAEMKRLAERGCHAFRIQPAHSKQPPETWLQPEPMEKLFATAQKEQLALSCLIRTDALPEVDRVCTIYPEAPVIIDHLCLLDTGDTHPVTDEHIKRLTTLNKHKNLYIKVGAFYALGERTPPYLDLLPLIEKVVEAFTPDRCMWETDCPFQVVNGTYEDSLALIRDHADFLSQSDKDKILRGTAERIFFD